jgi:Fe-Mn family superoxide dismutase
MKRSNLMATGMKNAQRTKSKSGQKTGQQRQGVQDELQGSPARTRQHELPQLPYALDALEPHMSAETLEFHHGKHHRTYVDKLNELIAGTHHADVDLEEIIRTSQGAIFNNAAQHWNHTFFWNCLSPDGGGKPKGRLARAIDSGFGSFDAFKDEFTTAATEHFASGWSWLVRDPSGMLLIQTTPNAETPITGEMTPLLTCDLWEHAYYIDYRNVRPDFIKAYWNVVNWEFADSNFEG